MLVSKRIIESILPDNLKTLIDETNFDNLNQVTENLQQSLEQVKNEINFLRETSIDTIDPEIKKTENFIDQINNLHHQIDNINEELDQQENLLKNVSQIEEYKNLIDHIETINKVIIIFEALREYELSLNELKYSIDSKNFVLCYELLNRLNRITNESKLFKQSNHRDSNENLLKDDEILVIKDLKNEFLILRERLWFELDLEWDLLIKIDSNQIQIDTKNLTQLHLNQLTQFSSFKSSQIDQASFVFVSKLKSFSKSFLNLIETKIVNTNFLTRIETKSDSTYSNLIFVDSNEATNLETQQILEQKLNQIVKLINFIYDNFFKYKVQIFDLVKNETQDVSLMSLFGDFSLKDFTKLVYENLIVNILPLTEFDFTLHEKFNQILSQFEASLKSFEYLQQPNKELRTFLSNLEEMYVRKKCKSLMENARKMMKNKDMMFELISTEETLVDFSNFKSNKLINDLLSLQNRIKQEQKSEIFKIPKFSISKFAKEFVVLIDDALIEAHKISCLNENSLKSVSLFCLVTRNLFDLYSSVIPIYYSSSLKDLPQLSAIVFNDFYYLSLNCLILGHKYKSLIKQLKSSSVNFSEFRYVDLQDLISNFNYVEISPNLYMLGYEILAAQVENQEKNLIEFLYEDCPNGIKDMSESNNFEKFKRSLQKCIFQLNNLSSTWHHILHENLFNKIIGQLIDLVLKDLVKSCLKLEDISSDDASYLHSAFLLMIQAIQDLYSKNYRLDKTDDLSNDLANLSLSSNLADLNACKYVSHWQKFKNLLIVLKANLQEIVDLWTDGKGPLAMHFEPDEIRHLIKALFMNTDRRQAALAKIK